MAIPIKSTEQIAQKFITVAPTRSADYANGVQNPTKSWSGETAKAEERYEAGVQEAIQAKRFGKGVQKAGDAKWQAGAAGKGVARWPEGIRAAGPAYAAGFAPYQAVIANTVLPPRFATGDPRNLDRVAVVAKNLHAKKVSG